MKMNLKFKSVALLIPVTIMLLIISCCAFAQDTGQLILVADKNPFSLLAVNAKTDKHVYFNTSQTVKYKLQTSNHFEKARILSITDSTVTLVNKAKEQVTVSIENLASFKNPKKSGPVLMVAGSVALLGAHLIGRSSETVSVSQSTGFHYNFAPVFLALAGTGMLVGGLVTTLKSGQINFKKSWSLKATGAIIPGNNITVTLKDGQVLTLRVDEINSDKITGTQSWRNSNGQLTEVKKTIFIRDISNCSRNLK